MLTIHHNAPMTKKRSKALWVVAALLVVNAVLLAAQPGLAAALARQLLLRAQARPRRVVLREGNTIHDYRIDRGVIRAKTDGVLQLRERDGSIVSIAWSPAATITLGGRPTSFSALRRNMIVTVIRDGDAPAIEVRAGGDLGGSVGVERDGARGGAPPARRGRGVDRRARQLSLRAGGYAVTWVAPGRRP